MTCSWAQSSKHPISHSNPCEPYFACWFRNFVQVWFSAHLLCFVEFAVIKSQETWPFISPVMWFYGKRPLLNSYSYLPVCLINTYLYQRRSSFYLWCVCFLWRSRVLGGWVGSTDHHSQFFSPVGVIYDCVVEISSWIAFSPFWNPYSSGYIWSQNFMNWPS